MRAAVDPERVAGTGNQEQKCYARIADDVAQRIHTVVATAVGQHQRLVVVHAHEAGHVAARRAVQPLRSAGRERGERRGIDEGTVMRRDPVDFLDDGCFDRRAVEGGQFFESSDSRHDGVSWSR